LHGERFARVGGPIHEQVAVAALQECRAHCRDAALLEHAILAGFFREKRRELEKLLAKVEMFSGFQLE